MKKILFLGIIAVLSLSAFAQKPAYKKSQQTKDVKTNLKNSAFDKVVKTIDDVLKNYPAEAGSDPEIYSFRISANRGLALAEEKKMYLKTKNVSQNPDTAKYFSYVNSLIDDSYVCDSLADLPDEKGKVKNSYRKQLTSYVEAFAPKLLAGVKFSYNHGSYDKCLAYTKTYMAQNKLTKEAKLGTNFETPGKDAVTASSLAVLSAFTLKSYSDVAYFIPVALHDTTMTKSLLEMAVVAYTNLGDTVNLEHSLLEGWKKFPDNDYFFLQLIKYYTDRNLYYPALDIVTAQTHFRPDDRDIWFIRANEESYLGLDEQAITSFSKCIELKSDDVESYSALGNIYLDHAHKLYDKEKTAELSDKIKLQQEIGDNNRLALSAFEQVRKLCPDDTSRWYSELKELYYKLNKGKELRALEKLKK